jgi:hypothetical protein
MAPMVSQERESASLLECHPLPDGDHRVLLVFGVYLRSVLSRLGVFHPPLQHGWNESGGWIHPFYLTRNLGDRMKLRTLTLSFLFVLVFITFSFAGWGRISGDERDLWKEYNVLVGKIGNIKKSDDQSGRYDALFTPSANIAGNFDCSACLELPVSFFIDAPGAAWLTSAITEVPANGSTVMVVLRFVPKGADKPSDSGAIASHLCEFMPHQSGMVVVNGVDDPAVAKTLLHIRRARLGAWVGSATTRASITQSSVKDGPILAPTTTKP